MISIIIPTLNEEKCLPLLISSIANQNFKDYEILIADAGSSDKTREIGKDRGARILEGGTPAQGRNKGAKLAKGELLLFLDADVVMPPNFFQKALQEFKERNLDVASFFLVPLPESNNIFWRKIKIGLFNLFYNFPILLLEHILPHAAMAILAKKSVFEKIRGFDETIKIAEDHDFARRAKKIFLYGILKSAKIQISTRRFSQDGWLRTYLKYFFCELYTVFLGPCRTDIFRYRFGHYFTKKKP